MISNNVTLIGNLGSDIEVRNFANDKCVGRVNLAYSSSYTNKQGEREERTDWFTLKAWNKTCTRMVAQIGKGSRVLIEGKLVTDSYEKKDGTKVNTVEIVVNSFQKIERAEKATTTSSEKLEEAPIF